MNIQRTNEIKSHWGTLHRRLHADGPQLAPSWVVVYLIIKRIHHHSSWIVQDNAGIWCILNAVKHKGVGCGTWGYHSQSTGNSLNILQRANFDVI